MDRDYLVSEIFIRPALWNRKDKNHHNRFVLDKLWDEVAFKLKTTRPIVRKKWKSLRDKFRITLASIPKPKCGDVQISDYSGEWRFFKSLWFLKDQFAPQNLDGSFFKNGDENMLDEASVISQDESDKDDVNEEVGEGTIPYLHVKVEHYDSEPSEDITPTSSRSSSPVKKQTTSFVKISQKRPSNDEIDLLPAKKEKLQFIDQSKDISEEDEDLNFFKSLIPHVRTFSAYNKLEYRMRVMKLTLDFLKPSLNSHPISSTNPGPVSD